jgi:REP element-mobilizing transposase RayT
MREHPVRKPTRIPGYDYASPGMYFITICLQQREPRFGFVKDGEMQLNAAGQMIASQWQENIARYSGAALDVFIVMPDHMHAIVYLGTDPTFSSERAALTRIVQSFKSLTTVEYTRGIKAGTYQPFDRVLWQRGFYDRILRNPHELEKARSYIEANPARAQEKLNALMPVDPLR